MVHYRSLSDQSRFSFVFNSLKIGKLLRDAGIRKSFGLPALAVFQLLFLLVFEYTQRVYTQTTQYLLGKGVLTRPPIVPMPNRVEFVEDTSYTNGFSLFGKKDC